MSSFAAIWWLVGAAATGRGSPSPYLVGLAMSALLILLGWRLSGHAPTAPGLRRHRGRVVGIASGVEAVTIVIAGNVLTKTGRQDLIAPVVAIIVGVHFLPLARWLLAPIYYATGALLVVVGLAGTAIQEAPARTLAVCAGAASALWLSCAVVLLQHKTGA
jgi:hypothetical protein